MDRDVPILLIAFRRPELTARVLTAIAAQRPARLFVAVDGARPQVEGEADLVRRTLQAVEEGVTWPCRLEWLVQPTNLGCRLGVVAGLDWFFAQVSEGIVLEDDILPDPSFFPYCAELLERYRQDPAVGAIAGATAGLSPAARSASYRFSRFLPVWGWASWRRAWQQNDPHLQEWPRLREPPWLEDLGGAYFARRMRRFLDQVAEGSCDTWDYGWFLSCWRHGMKGCVPAVNLVRNLGFGDSGATHCRQGRSPLPAAGTLAGPLRHPHHRQLDPQADARLFDRLYAPSLALRAWRRLGSWR
jgi:hypothetical protein